MDCWNNILILMNKNEDEMNTNKILSEKERFP